MLSVTSHQTQNDEAFWTTLHTLPPGMNSQEYQVPHWRLLADSLGELEVGDCVCQSVCDLRS
jgi:hypothetical protein